MLNILVYPSKFWRGLSALCAIVAVGALIIIIATVAPGGLILIVAAVAVATSAFAAYKEIAHDCDFTTKSKWINVHDTVKINGHKALIQNSKLICTKGGAITLVVDPVLARAAAQKIAANNTAEYNTHINSHVIQGTLFLLSSEGDPRALAVGLPLTIYNYATGEDKKIKERADAIEQRIPISRMKKNKGVLGNAWEAVSDKKGTLIVGRDAIIGVLAEAAYRSETKAALANNKAIFMNYPSIVVASLRSPMAALQLNSALVFRGITIWA